MGSVNVSPSREFITCVTISAVAYRLLIVIPLFALVTLLV